MSVRMRHTSSHTRNRRSHHALKNTIIVKDKDSGALRLPHRIDESSGMYRGKLIKPAKVKVTKATKDSKKSAQKNITKRLEGAPVIHNHEGHEHSIEKTANKEKNRGLFGKMTKERAHARSGTGV